MKTESLENELSKINIEISRLASIYEKDEETFLNSIETVDAEIAEAVYPLLQKQILILKQLWKIKVVNEGHSNLFLFSRTKCCVNPE